MITGRRIAFEARCRERGYTLEQVRPCVVSEDGDAITVDETHPAYPHARPASGPGTELKRLLARIGITATPNCSCNARARAMDANEDREPGWCEAHLDEIVGWLREEAGQRGLPFIDAAGRLLVRRAIRNARRA